MEADFQREYGLHLATAIDNMSWRRFQALLFGLSANARLWLELEQRNGGGGRHSGAVYVNDPKQAEQAVLALFRNAGAREVNAGGHEGGRTVRHHHR